MRTKVKICCISSHQEAKMAIHYGADAIGLVGSMPSGPGIIDNELIHAIAKSTPSAIATFLLTSETSSHKIIEHHRKVQTNTIQIVDSLNLDVYKELREALPEVKLVQVIHVLDEKNISEAIEVSEYVDTLLLDSGNPNLEVKELGGTGRTHNWALSRKIREAVNIPLFLAGGLHTGNVRRAIEEVEPFGVDLCSGVRTNGHLDEQKLEAFMAQLA